MTLHYSLGWLAGGCILGAFLGGFTGALAYWAGVRLGAALFNEDLFRCLLQIGLSRAIIMVLPIRAASRTTARDFLPVYRLFAEITQPKGDK